MGTQRHRYGRDSTGAHDRSSLPPKQPDMTWRDHAALLLHIGAEAEHALMVQYLYAAYSVGGDAAEPVHRDRLQRVRSGLLAVAREEMGHLLTVQNVLCLLGAPPNLERSDPPWDNPYLPFPFRLEPLSLTSIACYVSAEMKDGGEVPPSARVAHTEPDEAHVLISQVGTRQEAVAALTELAAQGEAPHLSDEPSHFERFFAIFDEVRDARGAPWSPPGLPTDPSTRPGPGHITNEQSSRWAHLSNLRYRMLLTCLAHSFQLGRSGGARARRAMLLHRAFGEMYAIKTLAGILFRLPRAGEADEERAGPPFEAPYTVAVPSDDGDAWRAQADLLEASLALLRELEAHEHRPELAAYLRTQTDLDRRALGAVQALDRPTAVR